MYARECIGVTGNGTLAVVASVTDLEALEVAQDLAPYREVIANNDGQRVSLDELYCPGRLVNRVIGGLPPMAVWGLW